MAKRIFLVAILCLAFAPFVAMGIGFKPSTGLRPENRMLAGWPRPVARTLVDASYFQEVEKYFNDHFGLRESLIARKHEADWALLRKSRPDLVVNDGYKYYKFIVQRYTHLETDGFPKQRMIDAFTELDRRLKARDIKLLVILFPNKGLIYWEHVPSYWGVIHDLAALPSYQACEELKRRGIEVWTLADEMFAAKMRYMVFSPLEENHISPVAFFEVMQKLLVRLGNDVGVKITPPETFPQERSATIEEKGYRAVHYINAAYGKPAPWRTYSWETGIGEYVNPAGLLPPTVLLTDSFLETLTSEFGPAFLPYFSRLSIYHRQFDMSAITPDTKLLVVGTSDQSVYGTLAAVEKMLEVPLVSH
jgi:hypothetical protein